MLHNKSPQKTKSIYFAHDCAGQQYKLGSAGYFSLVWDRLLYEFMICLGQLWASFTDLSRVLICLGPWLGHIV